MEKIAIAAYLLVYCAPVPGWVAGDLTVNSTEVRGGGSGHQFEERCQRGFVLVGMNVRYAPLNGPPGQPGFTCSSSSFLRCGLPIFLLYVSTCPALGKGIGGIKPEKTRDFGPNSVIRHGQLAVRRRRLRAMGRTV